MICPTCGRGGEPTTGTDTPLDACTCPVPTEEPAYDIDERLTPAQRRWWLNVGDEGEEEPDAGTTTRPEVAA